MAVTWWFCGVMWRLCGGYAAVSCFLHDGYSSAFPLKMKALTTASATVFDPQALRPNPP